MQYLIIIVLVAGLSFLFTGCKKSGGGNAGGGRKGQTQTTTVEVLTELNGAVSREQLAERLQERFCIDHVRSNSLETQRDGALTGEGVLRVPLRSKVTIVREVITTAGVRLENTAAIGDSQVDADMLRMCGLGIAFDPKDDTTVNSADVVIHTKDLREILPYVL